MRVGRNPAKSILEVPQPAEVTLATIVYIPFLKGYFENSLDVLKVCLASMLQNADRDFDFMVFDNGSCQKVRDYLLDLKEQGHIQYLVLSDQNLGKVGAWNVIFGAAPGKYVAYTDSDVFFYPGWISAHLKLFDAFPDAATVTGHPVRRIPEKYPNTLRMAEASPEISLEVGRFVPQEWCNEHAESLGQDLDEYVEKSKDWQDYRFSRNGVHAYANSGHFQFVARTDILRQVFPLKNFRPIGPNELLFDEAIDKIDCLRLSTVEKYVDHMGNTLSSKFLEEAKRLNLTIDSTWTPENDSSLIKRIARWRLVERVLTGLYRRIFWLYSDRRI
jgi:glycosyltransferase involved in cell wall biosynthesis